MGGRRGLVRMDAADEEFRKPDECPATGVTCDDFGALIGKKFRETECCLDKYVHRCLLPLDAILRHSGNRTSRIE